MKNQTKSLESEGRFLTNSTLVGYFLISSIVVGGGTDPFNLPKLFMITLICPILLFLVYLREGRTFFSNKALNSMAVGGFLGIVLSFFNSSTNLETTIFGVYGRNNGSLLAILLIGLLYISVLINTRIVQELFPILIVSLILTNSFFALTEFLGWNPLNLKTETYAGVLGLLGNPDFISGLLGIFISGLIVQIIRPDKSRVVKSIYLASTFFGLWIIKLSLARQGFVILFSSFVFAISIIAFKQMKNRILLFIGISIGMSALLLAFLGSFNFGPLASLLHKESMQYRLEYWKAGFRMVADAPLTGVGFGGYGDWYRFSRSSTALLSPGADTITNTAHNIYIDMAASGGVLYLFAYLSIAFYSVFLSIKKIRTENEIDYTNLTFLTLYIAYLIYGIVGIDQIGISIWGWILPGLLIGRYSQGIAQRSVSYRMKSTKISGIHFMAGAFIVVFSFLAALTPIRADFIWVDSLASRNLEKVVSQAKSYPVDEFRVSFAVNAAYRNGYKEIAYDISKFGVATFPRAFILWKMIYDNDSLPIEARKEALIEMIKLDPLNSKLKDDLENLNN